jgi:hypothetical protein
MKASVKARSFTETGDPIDALISACVSGEMAVLLPKDVHRWFASCCRRWLDAEGKIPMDRIMGLSGGKNPAAKTRLLKARDEMLHLDVATLLSLPLKALTGERRVTIEEATALVADRLAATDWNKSRWKLDQVAAGRIQNTYKTWSQRKDVEKRFQSVISKWSREQVRQYLLQFDTERLPRLKMFLQD